MNQEFVAAWLHSHPLTPIHVDCATTVMLKILDGKCKMPADEKVVMALLYEEIKCLPGEILAAELHDLIAQYRNNADEAAKNIIYEQRLLAETSISRPVMKGFKAMLRSDGLLKLREAVESD